MQENLFIRFNEIILLIYLISIICYFYDFVQKSHKIRSLGIYLLGIVWVLQTISLSIFIIQTRHIPLGSISDVFYTLSWLIISISLILNLIKVLNFSVFFLNLIGLTLLGMNTFQPTHYTNKVQKNCCCRRVTVSPYRSSCVKLCLLCLSFCQCITVYHAIP
ncbi:hypothetical protein CO85_0177 [Staphylococcus aureus subsp. aureus CO-85]|nr:hypothetical protein CO85_0177 [Staphylococcus aureus subsp. aureus CO-85]